MNHLEIHDYNHPMSLLFHEGAEVGHTRSSLKYLRGYQPETPGMHKAKSFWLKARKYDQNPAEREKIRQQYPEEVATLRRLVWEKHQTNMIEASISKGYFRKARGPNLEIPIPDNFINLGDYLLFEPEDNDHPSWGIKKLLGCSKPGFYSELD